jgi:hypothetical protein
MATGMDMVGDCREIKEAGSGDGMNDGVESMSSRDDVPRVNDGLVGQSPFAV